MKEFEATDVVEYSEYENEIDSILRDVDKQSFILTVKKVHSEYLEDKKREPKKRTISRNVYYYSIAAIVVIMIGVGSIIKFDLFSPQADGESVFNEYYSTYQNDFQTRSDQNIVQNLYLAFQAYENKEFDKAVELFSKVISGDESIMMAYFYKGISCIEVSDYKQAIESFQKVLSDNNNQYFSQAHWYCALTWLKLNNLTSAKIHLEWLSKNDRYYSQRAKEVLQKLSI